GSTTYSGGGGDTCSRLRRSVSRAVKHMASHATPSTAAASTSLREWAPRYRRLNPTSTTSRKAARTLRRRHRHCERLWTAKQASKPYSSTAATVWPLGKLALLRCTRGCAKDGRGRRK